MTVLDQIIRALRGAATYNRHEFSAPSIVLWPDGERLWTRSVNGLVKEVVPELLVLDPTAADARSGPATLLRYKLSRPTLGDATPIIYLPGVSRQAFRGAPGFPPIARHVYALQHQGQFWTQQNGKDWTPFAFLTSDNGGLGLDVSRDRATSDAIQDQLDNILRARVADLRGHRLEASDFHKLVTQDPHGTLLRWVGEAEGSETSWDQDRWRGFVAVCKDVFALDPERDGRLVAVERLAAGGGAWDLAWSRFKEAPRSFPGVHRALERLQPTDLLDRSNERIPANNRSQEDALREGLLALGKLPRDAAQTTLAKLAAEHLQRADSVWADLGQAPLAAAVAQLAILADKSRQGGATHDWESLASTYTSHWWQVDAAAWKALAAVRENKDVAAVSAALRAVYLPWLEGVAACTDALVQSFPNAGPPSCRALEAHSGTVILFVDGLRCDLGFELVRLLEGHGLTAAVKSAWSALPSVTATAKPAWRPMAERLRGESASSSFEPQTEAGKPLRTQLFRDLLAELGVPYLDSTALGDSNGAAWTEGGAFDRHGHEFGIQLAWRIEDELKAIVYRIRDLLTDGWRKVIVTTDHGWLLMPGGLPSVELPAHLTISKWGRCALPKDAALHGFRQVPWFWNAAQGIVLAPGVTVFRKNIEYAHGGLSLQEVLTPVVTVTAAAHVAAVVRIAGVKWTGLRAQVQLEGNLAGVTIDVRTKPADAASSVLASSQRGKAPGEDGRLSIIVENDDLLGSAAVIVALRNGAPAAKQTVTIGDN